MVILIAAQSLGGRAESNHVAIAIEKCPFLFRKSNFPIPLNAKSGLCLSYTCFLKILLMQKPYSNSMVPGGLAVVS